MQAVCFSCGGDKAVPLAPCRQCGVTPRTDEELSLSFILCRQFSPNAQLVQFAQQIRSGLGAQIPEVLLAKVRKALKDPQIAVMLRDGNRKVKSTDARAQHTAQPVRAPPPTGKETTLHRNPFWLLGATTRDNRRRLVELADERALERDADVCQKARADLTNVRRRLGAELAWLPGVSPAKAMELVQRLFSDPLAVRGVSGLPPLAHANLLAASLEGTEEQDDAEEIVRLATDIARLADDVSVDDVMRDISEDRAVAGFPALESEDDVEAGLLERKRYFRDALKSALERLPSSSLVDAMTRIVGEATADGEQLAPELIDLLVDSYEMETQGFLEKEAENVRKILKAMLQSAEQGEQTVTPLLDQLEEVARNWDKVAQPIQLSFKARGTRHQASIELAHEIRKISIELFNEHDMTTSTFRIIALLQELFAELPELVDRVDEDAEALNDFMREHRENRKEWESEITYRAEIGAISKATLSISPQGVSWKSQNFPLESITRVRWGAIRGTTYTIGFGDPKSEAVVELRHEGVFSSFTDKLWRAVGVRLLIELLATLKSGKEVWFGPALIRDDSVTLPRQRLFGSSEHVRCEWNRAHIWNADGSFYIGAKDTYKVYAELSYLDQPNTHILERTIRAALEKPGMRVLSDVLKADS